MAITCDRCEIRINPDIQGFEGKFFEEFDGAQIHLCDSCAPAFHALFSDFIDRKYDKNRIPIKQNK